MNLDKMILIHLHIRCLCTLLFCTAFGAVLSSNAETKVNPPQDFEIVDPGYLGYLYLLWQPPLFVNNFKDCTVEYELKYRNIDSASWKTIITKNLHYKDGFDLNKGIEAKILTFLPEQCTNGSKVKSSWSEATYWASTKGHVNTKIQDMECVYNNWQHLLCFWEPGIGAQFDSIYNLFYWYEGLDHAVQCPNYIKAGRKNIGCRFPHLESSDYKDFYICVNGTSQFKSIRSSYFIFQLQNIVKPLPADHLSLTVKDSEDIFLRWNVPRGPIPPKCFIYEIEFIEDDSTRFQTTTLENEMYVTKSLNESQKLCFSVRSKVNIYCAEDGIWSEWSEEHCWRGDILKETVILFLLPPIFVLLFVLPALCLLLSKQKALQKLTFCAKEQEHC
ncbi:interleukin-13 receptor subunit alpha-2 [Sorex araneus]|uniref:interleukin-13 receptor subunit alpha-2 n=1 Tax=Sorex araneus TaxID=42254 RepID=UPI00243355D2|nr:interleukin-13 receptor subunit alpha-2 [Sorex araneus]